MAEAFTHLGLTRLRNYFARFKQEQTRHRVEALLLQWLLHMRVSGDDAGWWFTYHAAVARRTGIPRATLSRLLDRLQADGHLEMTQKKAQKTGTGLGSAHNGAQQTPTLALKFVIYSDICEDDGVPIEVPKFDGAGTDVGTEVDVEVDVEEIPSLSPVERFATEYRNLSGNLAENPWTRYGPQKADVVRDDVRSLIDALGFDESVAVARKVFENRRARGERKPRSIDQLLMFIEDERKADNGNGRPNAAAYEEYVE